jgi:hypothetical protein
LSPLFFRIPSGNSTVDVSLLALDGAMPKVVEHRPDTPLIGRVQLLDVLVRRLLQLCESCPTAPRVCGLGFGCNAEQLYDRANLRVKS